MQRGRFREGTALLPDLGDRTLCVPRLRDVIAERGEEHVVYTLGVICHTVGDARPRVLPKVRVLHAELEAAFRALIELIPEPDCAFLDHADVAGAVGAASGRVEVVRWHTFRGAEGVVGRHVAISTDPGR